MEEIDRLDGTEGRGVDRGHLFGMWQEIAHGTIESEKEEMTTGIVTVVVIMSWTAMGTVMTDEMIGGAAVPMVKALCLLSKIVRAGG